MTDVLPLAPRCSRCFNPFTPFTVLDRVCAACLRKPVAIAPPPELETVWTPGRDAVSLSGEGLGSSLAVESHGVRL